MKGNKLVCLKSKFFVMYTNIPDDAISSNSFEDDVVDICPVIPGDEFVVAIGELNTI
jgi:hypothetical protein